MDSKNANTPTIEMLIERFYNGTSTPDEEKLIAEYFISSTDLPEHLTTDRELFFTIIDSQKTEIDIPADLEQKILGTIRQLDQSEKIAKRRFIYKTAISIAASFIIIFAIGWNIFFSPAKTRNEITDPAIAYAETVKALTLLSEKLNKADNGIIQTETTINDINNDINAILK